MEIASLLVPFIGFLIAANVALSLEYRKEERQQAKEAEIVARSRSRGSPYHGR